VRCVPCDRSAGCRPPALRARSRRARRALLAEPTLQLLGPSGHVKRGHRRRASLRGRVRLQPQFRAALATPRRGRPVSLPNRIESLLYEQPERRVERHDLGRKVGVREPLCSVSPREEICVQRMRVPLLHRRPRAVADRGGSEPRRRAEALLRGAETDVDPSCRHPDAAERRDGVDDGEDLLVGLIEGGRARARGR